MQSDKQYTVMAPFYDHLLRHVDYDQWYEYIKTIMYTYCVKHGAVLEIGTGTGKFGSKFSKDRVEITGIDLSLDMLKNASSRAHGNFRIINADARNFYFKKSFNFIFSVHDTLNYLTSMTDINTVFSNIKKHMDSDSIFMFDITTEYNIRRYFHLQSETFKINNHTIVWDNKYDSENRLIYSYIKIFKPDSTMIAETHVQKIHTVDEIQKSLLNNGFQIIDVFGDYTFEEINDETVMINFITRRIN